MTEQTNGYISRGNMTIILSSAGLIMVAFGAFVTQQTNAIDRQMARIELSLDKTLRKDEHEEFKRGVDHNITLIREEQHRAAHRARGALGLHHQGSGVTG